MSDDDENIFLSADIEGGNNGSRATRDALHSQKLAQRSVGKWTNPEKEQFALVDDWGGERGDTRANRSEMRNR